MEGKTVICRKSATAWFATATTMLTSAMVMSVSVAAETPEAWQFQGSIYLYLPSISGTTVFPPTDGGSDVSVDEETILNNLKMAFMGALEARKGRWGAFTDVVYVDLGNAQSSTRGLAIGGMPLPADVSAHLNFDLKGTAWTLAGAYRAVVNVKSPVDVFAGARLFDMRQMLAWQLSGNLGPIPATDRVGNQTASLSHWDAIAGVKGRAVFGDRRQWFVPYYLDVGTGESQLTWQAMVGVGYQFHWGDVILASRRLEYTMKSGEPIQRITFDGPAVAAVFHW